MQLTLDKFNRHFIRPECPTHLLPLGKVHAFQSVLVYPCLHRLLQVILRHIAVHLQ